MGPSTDVMVVETGIRIKMACEMGGVNPKIGVVLVKPPQIIHLFIGFSIIMFTIHFWGVPLLFFGNTFLNEEKIKTFTPQKINGFSGAKCLLWGVYSFFRIPMDFMKIHINHLKRNQAPTGNLAPTSLAFLERHRVSLKIH